ncbi:MAG TPA: AraC family transcriptional regulator [Planctomycetota bacterium]|nr:AraC family transcriptional regulator [Planctomycetota bacterium]
MLEYRERAPHPFLAPWVRCLWSLRGAPSPGALERVLPDGCMEWVFHLGEPFRIQDEAGRLAPQTSALLVGATTRAIVLAPSRDVDVVAIRFRPGGAAPFVRAPATRWRDDVVPLDASGDRGLEELERRLRETPAERRLDVLEGACLRRASRFGARARRLVPAVEALLDGGVSVDGVAHACALGARQLERRFLEEVGLSPRQVARVGRFQRAARLLESAAPLAAIAQASGYADQSHFGREFLAFAGITPARYRLAAHELASAFVAGG